MSTEETPKPRLNAATLDSTARDLAIDAAVTGDAVYRTIGNVEVKRVT